MSDGVNRRPGPTPRHVVVVGGGISGLAAAWFLHRDGPSDLTVTVLEGSPAIGGKLRVSEVAGIPVDEGAESLLLRRPEAVDLAVAVGLGDDLEDAATTSAAIWSRGEMRPIPTGTVMGIPADLRALARTGLLSTRELARVPADSWLPGPRLSGVLRIAGLAVLLRRVTLLRGAVGRVRVVRGAAVRLLTAGRRVLALPVVGVGRWLRVSLLPVAGRGSGALTGSAVRARRAVGTLGWGPVRARRGAVRIGGGGTAWGG